MQCDNCYRENKSRHHLAFYSLLVEKGWFSEIFLTFLPSGHTHEDIDRLFRRYHDLKKCDDCNTASEFIDKWIKQAYRTKVPRVKYITRRYDWKAWLHPHLHNLELHTKFRAFRFSKDEATGLVVMHVKVSPLDPSWIGRPRNPTVGFEMLRSYPAGFPRYLPFTPLQPDTFTHVTYVFKDLPDTAKIWWRNFFRDQTFWIPREHHAAILDASSWDIAAPAIQTIVAFNDPLAPGHPAPTTLRMNSQRILSVDEIEVGKLVAVPSIREWYAPGATIPEFWIGEVTGFDRARNFILLDYYVRDVNNGRKFKKCNPIISGECAVVGLYAHNFKLTAGHLVFMSTLKQIAAALEHDA